MRRRTLKVVVISAAVLILLIVAGTVGITRLTNRLDAYLDDVELSAVNIASLEDGVYHGEADAGIIKVSLDVVVQSGEIQQIRLLEHRNGKGGAGEGVLDTIVARQSTVVDTISGATYSSIILMAAVQNALNGTN